MKKLALCLALLFSSCATADAPVPSYDFDTASSTGVYWVKDVAHCVQDGETVDCLLFWELVQWTRHYELRMGLEEHEIQIGRHPTEKWCSWIDPWPGLGPTGLFVSKTVIHYDLLREDCANPRDRAKHETLHLRWKHHHIREMSYPEMEAEVAAHWEDFP